MISVYIDPNSKNDTFFVFFSLLLSAQQRVFDENVLARDRSHESSFAFASTSPLAVVCDLRLPLCGRFDVAKAAMLRVCDVVR